MKCQHEGGCENEATHGYAWPGAQRSAVCGDHLRAICAVTMPHLLSIEQLISAEPISVREAALERAALEVDLDEVDE